jgi:hypothetical protein
VTAEPARAVLTDAIAVGSPALDNFVLRGGDIATAQTSRFDLVATMAAQVLSDVSTSAEALTGKQFIPYDPSYQTSSSQVLVEVLSAIPDLEAVDATIRGGDVPDDAGGESPVAMVHAVGVGEHQIVAYRVKGPGIATHRAKWVQLIPRDGVYEPIEDEVLYYEPRFDVLTCAGYAYFTTVTLIQTKLNADDKARRLAKTTLVTVTTHVSIDGLAGLEAAVMDDPALRAKMASIARLIEADPEYAANLTTERLVAFVETNPDYDIPVTEVGGQRMLRFDPSPQHRHQIPKLLADDYLHSQLTNRNYEAGSKHRVQA